MNSDETLKSYQGLWIHVSVKICKLILTMMLKNNSNSDND